MDGAGNGKDGLSKAEEGRQLGSEGNRNQENAVGGHAPEFAANKTDTLLVVATLITALSYQLGTNIPGGFWQDDVPNQKGARDHVAGHPIMRDKDWPRYWLFMAASWAGFGSSMLLTVALLTGVPSRSRFVLWPFIVAYSSLVLAFVTSQPAASLTASIGIWVGVMAVVAVTTKYRRLDRFRCRLCSSDD